MRVRERGDAHRFAPAWRWIATATPGAWLTRVLALGLGFRVVRHACSGYVASGDIAAIELRVRDVFGPGVWLGPYSRFGWRHPGPLMFWAIAPFYEVFGERSVVLPIVAGLVNAASILGVGWMLGRGLGRPVPVVVLLPLVALVSALGSHLWTSAWNPDLPILPLAWFVSAAWVHAVGRDAPTLLMVIVGAFVVQTHVGFVVPVVLVAVAAVVFRAVVDRSRGGASHSIAPASVAMVAARGCRAGLGGTVGGAACRWPRRQSGAAREVLVR
jgi:hypothetical protein